MTDSLQPIHPSISPSILTSSIESLIPALELLSRFHHRNKNQHRLSKWWSQADMLRRHTRKMVELIEDVLPEAEKLEKIRKANSTKLNKKPKKDPKKEENESVTQRALYMRWQLGPRAFLAFTQLTADRQFAHLGLMLLGVLAQIDKALEPYSPSPPADQLAQDHLPMARLKDTLIAEGIPPATHHPMDTDQGIAVSRDSLPLRSVEQPDDLDAGLTRPAKKKKLNPDSMPTKDITAINSKLSAKTSKKPVRSEVDEFDAIFASTTNTTKKKKMTKPVVEDEFDVIFGGGGGDGGGEPKKTPKKPKLSAEEFDNKNNNGTTIFSADDEKPKPKNKKIKQPPPPPSSSSPSLPPSEPLGEDSDEEPKSFFSKKKEIYQDAKPPIQTNNNSNSNNLKKKQKKKKEAVDEFDDIFGSSGDEAAPKPKKFASMQATKHKKRKIK